MKRVLFPAPFGPTTAWHVPGLTLRLTSDTATIPPNLFVSPSVLRISPCSVLPVYDLPPKAFRRRLSVLLPFSLIVHTSPYGRKRTTAM